MSDTFKSLYELAWKLLEERTHQYIKALGIVRGMREFIYNVQPNDPCGWEWLERLKREADEMISEADEETKRIMSTLDKGKD